MNNLPEPRPETLSAVARWGVSRSYGAPAVTGPGERPWEPVPTPPWVSARRRAFARVIDVTLVVVALGAALVGSMLATTGLVAGTGQRPGLGEGGGSVVTLALPIKGNSDWARSAAAGRVIEVVDAVPGSRWDVRAAVNWLDRYTGSDMRIVARCSAGTYRCVTVRRGKVSGDAVGWSRGGGASYTLTIDTAKAGRAQYGGQYNRAGVRTWLIAHELGHTFGLKHTAKRNLMNPYTGQGKLALTSGQKKHLANR
jgi:hypothetical protein